MAIEQTVSANNVSDFVGAITDSLGAEAIEVLDPKKHEGKHDSNSQHDGEDKVELKEIPPCATQQLIPENLNGMDQESRALDIFVGLFGTIPRWKKGTTVNFACYANGYPAPGDAVYAATRLWQAAQVWNNYNVGVKFKWVGALADAAFVLGYGGNQGGLVARAYFPNANALNNVIVCKRAFDADLKPYMWRFFLHELGHVIGLRHEFAMDPKNPPTDNTPKEGGAVQIGPRNVLSVMNYGPQPPLIQQSDVVSTRAFYNFNGPSIAGVPVKVYLPDN